MYIYAVYKCSDIVYIGQTARTIEKRWAEHLSHSLSGRGGVLGAGIRKHGANKFTVAEIATAITQDELDNKERDLIALHNPRYNILPGGRKQCGSWNKGKKMNDDYRARARAGAQNRRRTKRGPYSAERLAHATTARRKRCRPFTCIETNQIFRTIREASEALNILPTSIYAVLNPKHRMKTAKGYTFKYLQCN